jgi:hypothetical protein
MLSDGHRWSMAGSGRVVVDVGDELQIRCGHCGTVPDAATTDTGR